MEKSQEEEVIRRHGLMWAGAMILIVLLVYLIDRDTSMWRAIMYVGAGFVLVIFGPIVTASIEIMRWEKLRKRRGKR